MNTTSKSWIKIPVEMKNNINNLKEIFLYAKIVALGGKNQQVTGKSRRYLAKGLKMSDSIPNTVTDYTNDLCKKGYLKKVNKTNNYCEYTVYKQGSFIAVYNNFIFRDDISASAKGLAIKIRLYGNPIKGMSSRDWKKYLGVSGATAKKYLKELEEAQIIVDGVLSQKYFPTFLNTKKADDYETQILDLINRTESKYFLNSYNWVISQLANKEINQSLINWKERQFIKILAQTFGKRNARMDFKKTEGEIITL